MRLVGRLLAALLVGGIALGVALAVGVARSPSRQVAVAPGAPIAVDADRWAAALAGLIAIPSVSLDGGEVDGEAFAAIRARLEADFPAVHATLRREIVAGHTLVYTWPGADPTLPPGVLMAHQDVVPADAAGWTVPPFEGRVADGFVWGRGALDDKNNLVAELAAVEVLLERGYRPTRTLHLVFGHDEEVGGTGARAAATALVAREQLGWVVDEGGPLLRSAMNGLAAPAALIGIAEKGYVTVELEVKGAGGHSSMPPPSTAAGRLAAAVARLEQRPMPARIAGPVAQMLDAVGPEMDLGMRVVMANRWLFGPVVRSIMAGKPSTNASLRTTAAVTMLRAGEKENVLPQDAVATVNFRILPGDSVGAVLSHVRDVVADPAVEVRASGGMGSEPSPVSRTDGFAFEGLATSVREQFPGVVVAPFLMVGATDARWFAEACDEVYRFSPVQLDPPDLDRLHGVDERIAVDALADEVAFFTRWIERGTGPVVAR